MTTRTWIRRLFARTPRTIRQEPARCRPRLEALEGRLAPAVLTVNSTADNTTDTSVLTLREAIAIVNTSPALSSLSQSIQNQISGGLHAGKTDTIQFDPTKVTAPITLGSGQLELSLPSSTAAVTIDGGAAGVTVDGNKASRIFRVDGGVTAALNDLTISNGNAGIYNGGGISNAGTLTVSNCTLSGNSAGTGGGIDNDGTLTVSNCTLSGNSIYQASAGGGIANAGTLTVSNCTLSGNSAAAGGGGIGNSGTATVSNCTLSGNSGPQGGGGMENDGTLTLNNTIVANSPSGGDVFNFSGTITGSHNLIDDGSGGLSDTITADPKLDPNGLHNNGGPTQTIKLLAGSPAIDHGGPDTTLKSAVDALAISTSLSVVSAAGLAVTPGLTIQIDAEQMTITAVNLTSNTFTVQRGANFTTVAQHTAGAGLLPATDQRGLPRISGAAVDIGAFEVQQSDFSISVSPTSLTVPPGSGGAAIISTAVTAGSAQTVALSAAGLPPGVTASFSPASVTTGGSSTLSVAAAASAAAGTFTVTITGTAASGSHTTTLSLTIGQLAQTITFAPLANEVYGVAPLSLGATASSGLPVSYTISGPAALSGNTLTVTGAGVVAVTAFQTGNATYAAAPPVQQSFTVSKAPLSATGVNFSATAGAPFSGTVATVTTPETVDGPAAFTATITWEDGSTSGGVITGGNGSFTVSGSHTFAAAGSYTTLSVTVSNPNTQSATASATAAVTSLGQGVQPGQTAGIGFWHNNNGQALITSFNVTPSNPSPTALSCWLAATFPNLYGAGAGANNLAGKSNAQVAAFYLTQFDLTGPKVEAQVLAAALNVYATTASLGGSAGTAYGFTVSATGLGARSYNVGSDGAAFGAANNTTLNVYALLLAVNKKAANGVLYNGDAALRQEAADLFDALSQDGSIG
jgi:hypothetical protein